MSTPDRHKIVLGECNLNWSWADLRHITVTRHCHMLCIQFRGQITDDLVFLTLMRPTVIWIHHTPHTPPHREHSLYRNVSSSSYLVTSSPCLWFFHCTKLENDMRESGFQIPCLFEHCFIQCGKKMQTDLQWIRKKEDRTLEKNKWRGLEERRRKERKLRI